MKRRLLLLVCVVVVLSLFCLISIVSATYFMRAAESVTLTVNPINPATPPPFEWGPGW
jgi:uncharacterized membrane-anchored protein